MKVPQNLDNSVYSIMDWFEVTDEYSRQYALRESYRNLGNRLFDNNGLADIFGRKVIACVDKFGSIGDEVEITFKNPVYYWNDKGTLFAIIGDFKDYKDSNNDGWGHLYTKIKGRFVQRSVVEFIVNIEVIDNIKDVFTDLIKNPVIKIERTGVNFFDKIKNFKKNY